MAGLFYTVIPLYQKAAVDEQLARREADLKVVEAALAEVKAETYRLRAVYDFRPQVLQCNPLAGRASTDSLFTTLMTKNKRGCCRLSVSSEFLSLSFEPSAVVVRAGDQGHAL